MILLVILMLGRLVTVWSQSTVLDSHCVVDCRSDVRFPKLVAMKKNMETGILLVKHANERSQKKIIELETKLASQKTLYDIELSNLNSQLSDQENKFEIRIQELNQKMKNQKNAANQLQTDMSQLESKIQIIESGIIEDCEDIRALGYQTSGVYVVNAENRQTSHVYCELSADGGAWTRILHRQDNVTDFTYKKWADYEAGFGDPKGSHWIGLILMNQLTTGRDYMMRVDLEDWDGETRYAEYSRFRVGSGLDKYRLTIGGYNGTAGDAMAAGQGLNKMMFTTIDSDNDNWKGNCANGAGSHTGGWWYNRCFNARLTGSYLKGGNVPKKHGIYWGSWRNKYYSYKVATMKVQRL